MSPKKQNSLIAFLQKECANWDGHYQVCLLTYPEDPKTDRPCCVMQGKRCGYFEKAVLGPPDYKFRLPGYDYTKLFAQYADQTSANVGQAQQRFCECGAPLRYRQRYCGDCSKRRAKKAHAARQRKYRNPKYIDVTL
jgi:hypothetical protein